MDLLLIDIMQEKIISNGKNWSSNKYPSLKNIVPFILYVEEFFFQCLVILVLLSLSMFSRVETNMHALWYLCFGFILLNVLGMSMCLFIQCVHCSFLSSTNHELICLFADLTNV